MEITLALTGLFGATFLAATIFPFQSEVVFLGLQALAAAPLWLLVGIASLGNTLGAFVNYWLGTQADRPGLTARFRLTPQRMARARALWARWGVWSLLMSWAPVIGWVTVIAGTMRTPLWRFALLVALSKTGRFVILGLAAAPLVG